MAISLTDRFCRGVAAHLRTRLIRVGPESIISFRKILDPGFTFSTQLRSKPGEPERSHPRQAKDTSQTSPNPKTAARIRVTAFLGSRHSSEKLAGADQESARLTLALPFSRRAVPPTKVTEFCSRMACLSTELRCQAGYILDDQHLGRAPCNSLHTAKGGHAGCPSGLAIQHAWGPACDAVCTPSDESTDQMCRDFPQPGTLVVPLGLPNPDAL